MNIKFNKDVFLRDHPRLSHQHDVEITKRLRILAAMPDPTKHMDVEPCASPLDGYYKYKPSPDMRHICDAEYRIVFKVVPDGIYVLGLGAKTMSFYPRMEQRASHQ